MYIQFENTPIVCSQSVVCSTRRSKLKISIRACLKMSKVNSNATDNDKSLSDNAGETEGNQTDDSQPGQAFNVHVTEEGKDEGQTKVDDDSNNLNGLLENEVLNNPLGDAAEDRANLLKTCPEERDDEKQSQQEKIDRPMAEREPLITSGRHSANYDYGDEDNEENIVCSHPGSAIDANINVTYQDSSSDYHDYSTRIDANRPKSNIPSRDGAVILYRRRWYILLVLSLCVTLQNAVWGTWGPIAESAKFVYGWDTTMVFIIINCGNIGVLLPALFTGHVISGKGLRVSMVVCSFLLAIGAGLRPISRDKTIGTILIGAGQFCNGLAGSITQVIPAALSETWFPINERATATAIGVISNSLGSIVAFMLGPNLVNEPNSENSTTTDKSFLFSELSNTTWNNDTDLSDVKTISHQIWILTMIEFGVGALLFIITLVYFPAKPPTPPSRSAREERINFTQGLCTVIKQPLILLAAMSCAVPWAVYGNWMGLVNVNLHEIGISQSQSGLFGFYASIAGVVGGIAIGRIADRFQRRLKLFVMLVFLLALLIIVWITCMRIGYLPRSIALFAVSISALGFMMNAALPLCYEMACECGYPIHEGIIGVTWMNWTFVGVLATSIICLTFLREKYRRADVDIRVTSVTDKDR
ncbi:solute carrier family 49 member 4-like isoform X2 [Mercenaria mercenaria]|uniref:solute carrier family 49 member 4-like isoform X2 n=1 Tax=Mercenaria mercenaria TaxID=6596 RepID=UPI00234F2B5B|nr:solute carrier family 49 member 4-like isoform X2 [Mercenaria mercenaria]